MRRWAAGIGLALMVIVAAPGAACRNGSSKDARTACDEARRQFCDPQRTLTVRAGQTFTIIFHSNASIGDQWRFEEPIDAVILRSDGTDHVSDSPGAAGSGRTEIWTFAALAPGTAHIRLANYYGSGPITERRDYQVTVQ